MEVDELTCTETVVEELSNDDSLDDSQSQTNWESKEMREENPMEEEIDDEIEENLRGNVSTVEIRHQPGEYQFQLLPIHVHHRGDPRTGEYKVFECDICGMVYRHVFSLKRHFLRCHINYKYLTSTDITNCGIHMQVIHAAQSELSSDDLYRCHICHKLFPEREQLREHTLSHPAEKEKKAQGNNISCGKCTATFADRKSLLRHQLTHSGSSNNKKIGQSSCKYCGKTVAGQVELRRHERLHETNDTTCKVCKVSFTSAEYVEHKNSVHPDNNHLCSYCEIILQDVPCLSSHLTQVHGRSLSENAQQIANKENGLNNQIKEELTELETKPDRAVDTTVSCDQCNKTFTSLVNLQRHNTVVHIKPMDKRPSTDFKFKHNGNSSCRVTNEEDFYRTLDQRISDNLQFHIDGRSPGKSQTSTTFESERVESNCMPWLVNNFPPTFDITHIVQIYANRPPIARPLPAEATSFEDQTALSAGLGLNPVKKKVERENRILFICQVCGHSTDSEASIVEHKESAHKNIIATHLELEGHSSVPPGLSTQFEFNKVGVLKSAEALKTNDIHRCTKCNRTFAKVGHLHSHIIQCGQLSATANFNHFARPPSPRQIKQRKFGPVLNTKRCEETASNSGHFMEYGKDDPRKKRKIDDRPQRRSARSTYTGGPSECGTCGHSFPSQASLRKHILDECRDEPAYRKKKRKDSPTSTPEPIKISSTSADGWDDDYLDGKGPDQYLCEACSATFGGVQQFRRHLAQCSMTSRTKNLLPYRMAPASSTSSCLTSQYEEMTVLGLVQRAERDRQRNFRDTPYEKHQDDDDDDEDDEDTKVYRCPTCHMGFGDYVKMIHHSLHEHGTPIPDAQTFHRESNGIRNGHSTAYSQSFSTGDVDEEMHEEEVQDDCEDETMAQLNDEDELRLKERIAIEALSAFSSGGSSFLHDLGLNNNHHNNNNHHHHNNNNGTIYGTSNKLRPNQPLTDHRYLATNSAKNGSANH